MPKQKDLKKLKGRAKQKVLRSKPVAEVAKAPPLDPGIQAILDAIREMNQARVPEPDYLPAAVAFRSERPKTKEEALQDSMGLSHVKNREWRDHEVLMSKIGSLEAFRDIAIHVFRQIGKRTGVSIPFPEIG